MSSSRGSRESITHIICDQAGVASSRVRGMCSLQVSQMDVVKTLVDLPEMLVDLVKAVNNRPAEFNLLLSQG